MADFEVLVDPDAPVAKIVMQDTELVLNEGEWSDWVRVDFEVIPYVMSISAIGRFYLQEVRPDFKLYVTPLQINPEDPANPLSNPEGWSADLHDVLGPFYTQELPEETKAFSEGVFDGREFWEQSQFVYGERRRALDRFLDTFEEGLLFFYFSSVDQGSHMLYNYADTEHPLHEPDELLGNGIRTLYEEMDEALGRVLEVVNEDDNTTLIVMSDHGFSPFYWGVNLNTWLLEQGYVTLKDPSQQGRFPMFVNVDWSRTRAYAFGMGGVYVNLRGRERDGIVEPGAEYERLLDDLERDLLAMVDEGTGANPISLVYQTAERFLRPVSGPGPRHHRRLQPRLSLLVGRPARRVRGRGHRRQRRRVERRPHERLPDGAGGAADEPADHAGRAGAARPHRRRARRVRGRAAAGDDRGGYDRSQVNA